MNIALGRAVGDPVGDQPFLIVGQVGVVAELAMIGAGVPGGHAAVANDLGNRLGPAGGLLIVGQGKRRDLTRSVAGDTMVAQEARDLLRIGHLAVARTAHAADPATDGLGLRHGDRLAGQQFLQRNGQVAARGSRPMHADRELVIDAAAVSDRPLRIQHQDFRRPLDSELSASSLPTSFKKGNGRSFAFANRLIAVAPSCWFASIATNATPFDSKALANSTS